MKRLPVIAALVVLAATLVVMPPGFATEYADNPNPACRLMRNNVIGAPFPPEPNRDDTRRAMALAGDERNLFGNIAAVRRQYAQAFELLQKIDAEGTDRLALLPADTPRIDLVIDRHIINLTWARAMLGIFYEQGRAPKSDPGQTAAFYQKSLDTRFVDDRGCVHSTQPGYWTLTHLAGLLIYGLGVDQDRARAKALLQQAGAKAASAVYLLDKNALPPTYGFYLSANLDDLADTVRNPPQTETDMMIALLGRILLWCAVAVVLFVGAVGIVRFVRRKLGYKTDASLYRAAFAAYDVIHGLVARFGLVAEGLIGCFVGLSILFGGYVFGSIGSLGFGGFGIPYGLIVIVSGMSSLLGGISKLVEAGRVSAAPKNTLVHGAARPAAEPEAHAAARGVAKVPDLHERKFSD